MEPLDREIAEAFKQRPAKGGHGRILVVSGDDAYRDLVIEALIGKDHDCKGVATTAAGHREVNDHEFDVVLLDLASVGAEGLDLARRANATSPSTKSVIIFESKSFTQAVQALRCGVADLVHRKVSTKALVERIELALAVSRDARGREDRMTQLEIVCRKLVASRQEVSEHLDKLCEDLAAAYEDVNCQVSEVATATEFRTLLKQELDLEDLLRTALEYMLAKTGPTNAAVFLPDSDGNYELGAYVNYDCPRETITVLLNHLCRAVCPQMAGETEIVSFEDADEFAGFIGADAGFLAGCQVIAMSCRHDGRCLATLVLFRNREEPFDERMAITLEILRTIFAEQIANVIKIHHRATPDWPKEATGGEDELDYDDFGFGGLAA